MRPEKGFIPSPLDQIFRAAHISMSLGQQVSLSGMSVEVTALTENGQPAEAVFRFDVPLEHPSLKWIRWQKTGLLGHYVPFTPPRVGEPIQF